MRSTLLSILSLLILSLCAHSSPLPLDPFSFSSRNSIPNLPLRTDLNTIHHPPPPPPTQFHPPKPLSKRTPNEFSIVKPATAIAEEASEALTKQKAKDWKRPIVIPISVIGLTMTVGWNYISLQSFLSNRARFRREQKRLEAEKSKPPPKLGDVVCTIETYSTEDQVAERKPGSLKVPCYRLGDQGGQAGEGTGGVAPSVAPAPVVQSNGRGVAQPAAQVAGLAAAKYGPAAAQYQRGSAGGLTKRGILKASGVGEIVQETTTAAKSSSAASAMEKANQHFRSSPFSPPSTLASSSSRATAPNNLEHIWIPLSPISPTPHITEEKTRLLSSPSRSEFIPRQRKVPGFAVPLHTPPTTDVGSSSKVAEGKGVREEKKAGEGKEKAKKGWSNVLKGKKLGGKKISTDDITFGLTILNTIGGIPSLLLTTANAYYYRGNPKVD